MQYFTNQLIVIIITILCSLVNSQTQSNHSQVATITYKIYIKQHQFIYLGKKYSKVNISTDICQFHDSVPHLQQIYQLTISSDTSDPSNNIIANLRNYNLTSTEDIIILSHYILIIHNFNRITVLKRDGQIYLEQISYTLLERKEGTSLYALKFENNVFMISQQFIYICNQKGYIAINNTNMKMGKMMQINKKQLIIINSQSITVVNIGSDNIFSIQKQINLEYLSTITNINHLMIINCKIFGLIVYCLDRNNGLFKFKALNMQFQELIQKQGCKNFLVLKYSVIQKIVFDCNDQDQSYLIAYPENTIISQQQSNLRNILQLETDNNILLMIQNSRLIYYDMENKNIIYQQKFQQSIKKFYQDQYSRHTKSIFYILFQDSLQIFTLNYTRSFIDCYSQSSQSLKVILDFVQLNGFHDNYSFYLQIRDIPKLNIGLWIIVLLIAFLLLVSTMITCVLYYLAQQKKWQKSYEQIKSRIDIAAKSAESNVIIE